MLYEQRFVVFDGGSGLAGYDVVVCSDCGFVYADGLPASSVFERYYREMSKYDPDIDEKPLPAYKHHNHHIVSSELARRLPDRSVRILDVGSASGELLSVLRQIGYENLTGLDPSARCAEVAMRRHGIRVLNAPISQMATSNERFDLLLLGGVLEHVRDLGDVLFGLRSLLRGDGAIFIAVPNAERFAAYVEAPYQHLSMEHINFFTLRSLESLFAAHGMWLADSWETTHLLGAMREPTINAIFRSSSAALEVARDATGAREMARYLSSSMRLQDSILSQLGPLIAPREPLMVWGVGSLTMHLLCDKPFGDLNIVAFVDANENYWGKTIRGVPVLDPGDVRRRSETILVSSYSYGAEIVALIRGGYHLANRVVTLFGDQAP